MQIMIVFKMSATHDRQQVLSAGENKFFFVLFFSLSLPLLRQLHPKLEEKRQSTIFILLFLHLCIHVHSYQFVRHIRILRIFFCMLFSMQIKKGFNFELASIFLCSIIEKQPSMSTCMNMTTPDEYININMRL